MKPYKTITLRLNAREHAHLREQADTTGLKMEPLIRQLILGVELRPRPPDTYAALLRELSAIGNNVNQLAHAAWRVSWGSSRSQGLRLLLLTFISLQ